MQPLPLEEPGPRWSLRHGVLAFAAGLAASVIAVVIASASATSVFRYVVPAQNLAIIAVLVWASRRLGDGTLRADFGLDLRPADGLFLAAGVAIQFVLALVSLPFFRLAGIDESPQAVSRLASEITDPVTIGMAFIGVGVLGAVAEELLFRGLVLRALLRTMSPGLAVVLSAAAFSLVHVLDPGAAVIVPQLFIVGLVLAWLTLASGRLGWAVFTHMGFNLVAVVALVVAT